MIEDITMTLKDLTDIQLKILNEMSVGDKTIAMVEVKLVYSDGTKITNTIGSPPRLKKRTSKSDQLSLL
jgi:hypothetical protein